MSFHSRVSPSALSRVRRCPGSVRATEHLPRGSTKAAAEGTVLHEIAADCLEFGFEPQDYVGRTMAADGHEFAIGYDDSETDPTCMIEALDWLREQPGEIFIEKRVSLDPYMPGQSGSMDIGIYTPEVATVFDWKFGAGVLVQTKGNEQGLGYATGFLTMIRELGWEVPPLWRIIIEQPRAPGGARYYEPWEITLEELEAFGAVLEQIWAAANEPNAPRSAGEKQCRFCAAKEAPEGCPEHSEFVLALVGMTFSNLDEEGEPELPDPGRISPARRSFIVRHASMFTRWLDKLHADTLLDALTGRPTPGLKAIDGRAGAREYADEAAAEVILVGALAADAFTKKLKSPAQAEKVMKPTRAKPGHPEAWEKLQALVTQKEGKPVLVPEEDPRPAKLMAVEAFDDLDAEDSANE